MPPLSCAPVKFRRLPQTDLKVSEVGFGVWTVASPWWGITDPKVGVDMLRAGFDAGITFFDTADNYGNGKGETILAEALGEHRDAIVIGSKWGYNFYDHKRDGQNELPQDFTPAYLRRSIEQSLGRLRTDRIDLLQMHNPRVEAILRDDTFAELETLRQEGKIRSYGVSLGPAIHERQIEEGVAAIEKRRVAIVQLIFNLFEQMLGPKIFAAARTHGAGTLVRVPHSSGLLDGTVSKDTTFGPNDHRSFRKTEWRDQGLKKVERLAFLLEGRTIGQAALQFVLSHSEVVCVFPNLYNEAQVKEFAATSDTKPLDGGELAKLEELYRANFGVEVACP